MTLPLYFLSVAGATAIICHGSIFKWLRYWLPVFKCPACVGFWMGLFFSGDPTTWGISDFYNACAASLISYAACMIIGDDGLRISVRGLLDANGNQLCQQQHKEIMAAIDNLNQAVLDLAAAVTTVLSDPRPSNIVVQAAADAVAAQTARLVPPAVAVP